MNKNVLITGASSGMGKETALLFLSKGYAVFAAARSLDKMKDLQEAGATVLQMDITDEEQVLQVVETLEKAGGVDILINNAGFGLYGAIEDVPLEQARYQFEVNLFGLGRLTQAVLPQMRAKRSGTIVNISSMGGKIYTLLGGWYHATKHALEGWSDCLRIEVKQFGINVIVIEPGLIETNFSDTMNAQLQQYSFEGSYGELARKTVQASEVTYKEGGSTPPRVISELIYKAVTSKNPKTRYVAGKYARLMMFVRKWLGDRVFDRVLISTVERVAKRKG